ncbi:MAG TPA: fibrobacter succinogenes major paralogous domain-containing protein [Bacteroidales bacterium]
MGKAKAILVISSVFFLLFSFRDVSGQTDTKSTQKDPKSVQTKAKTTQPATKSVQTKTKSVQSKSKSVQKSIKSEPAAKKKDLGTVTIGTQTWAVANLNVNTFRNGDTITEARTNKEWQTAGELGKPAWCYYNNDPSNGSKYGKLYNWYALNDPRGLAPVGWTLSGDADWAKLSYYLGGQEVAGRKLKSTGEWIDGNIGTNETGFMGFPGGYRVENGAFLNFGSIGTWWSSTENKSNNAIDHYLAQSNIFGRSSSPKQRGESVRCIIK